MENYGTHVRYIIHKPLFPLYSNKNRNSNPNLNIDKSNLFTIDTPIRHFDWNL
jgi:hypothetical protein